jgi:hypothetical protein
MIYCANCGTPLPDDAAFCSNCGTKTATPPPAVTEPTPKTTELFTEPETPVVPDLSATTATPDTDIFAAEDVQAKPLVWDNPNWLAVKKYIIFFIAACFLWSIFNVFTVRVEQGKNSWARWNDDSEEAEKRRARVAGHNLLFGSLPNLYVTEDGETRNETKEALENVEGPAKRAARIPMIFRIGYWVFVVGLILYVVSLINQSRHKSWYETIGVATAFIGLLSVFLVYNDLKSLAKKAAGFAGIDVSLKFTFGFWGLFLAFAVLLAEHLFTAVASFSVKQQDPYTQYQNTTA